MAEKLNKLKVSSALLTKLEQKKTQSKKIENFKVSFQFVDSSQKFGSSFKDWQKEGLLALTLEVFQGYCQRPLWEQVRTDKFTVYNDFPPCDKTMFEKPKHVPEDACWARIHINGSAVVAGHIVDDTFYVVFLDKTHKFFLTKRVTSN